VGGGAGRTTAQYRKKVEPKNKKKATPRKTPTHSERERERVAVKGREEEKPTTQKTHGLIGWDAYRADRGFFA
jgi:hypothetical protein